MKPSSELRVPLETGAVTALVRPADKHPARASLILAHGAGAGQGSRDNFGTPSELNPILAGLSPAPTLHVVAGGDHSLKVPRRNPQAQAAVYNDVQRTIVEWMQSVIDSKS